jgi:hypothetical protein
LDKDKQELKVSIARNVEDVMVVFGIAGLGWLLRIILPNERVDCCNIANTERRKLGVPGGRINLFCFLEV